MRKGEAAEPGPAKKPAAVDSERAKKLEGLASELGFFGALSGGRRREIATALGEAAGLERDRAGILQDRRALQEALTSYHDAMAAANFEMKRFSEAVEKLLADAQSSNADAHAANEVAARRQLEARDLLERLETDHRTVLARNDEVTKLQAEVARTQTALDERAAAAAAAASQLAAREGMVAKEEGAVTAGLEALAKRQAELAAAQQRQAAEQARLAELEDRLQKDQHAVNGMHVRIAALLDDSRAHERLMDGHQTRLEERLVLQDTRQAELDGTARQQARTDAELDAKIARLGDLDEKNERLMQLQQRQEDERVRLNTELSVVQRNHKDTQDTWTKMQETLRRVEVLAQRVQGTNDTIEDLRRRTEAREKELEEKVRRERATLLRKSREIDSWTRSAELRERAVQARFNELEILESKKAQVRAQIERLETDHAARIAAFETEQVRQHAFLAERRAEAEKARELYEANMSLVDERLDEVVRREEEHKRRMTDLAARDRQLADRERLLAARDEQISVLSLQRDSLNNVIASLTTQIGRDWSSPESTLGSGLDGPPIDELVAPPDTRSPKDGARSEVPSGTQSDGQGSAAGGSSVSAPVSESSGSAHDASANGPRGRRPAESSSALYAKPASGGRSIGESP